MPRKKAEDMSPAEWKIMKIVWELKACAIGEVLEIAQKEQGWARSTVKTILKRLVDKGFVSAKRVGNSFLYRPARSPLKSMLNAIDVVLENALEGTSGPILAHVIKKCDLSEKETEELQNLLAEHAAEKRNRK
jgi:BlaI family transcriptional regulator, penicillinase repressor